MVKIANLKNHLSRHLAAVRRGGEIVVYDRDTPIARIVPFVPRDPATDRRSDNAMATATAERVAGLVRDGVLSPGEPRAVAEWLDGRAPVVLPAGAPSAVEVLLEMRRQSTR